MDGLYDKLLVLNSVYKNTIHTDKTYTQYSQIKTPLFQHQNVLVNGMHSHREKMIRGFVLENQAINGKIGIIGDPPGTGKTLSILAYIMSQVDIYPKITCELVNNSSKYFFSHELYNVSNASTNLIIVPHSLFNQWKQEILKHSTIEYVPIETKRCLKGDISEKIINGSFILTTNNCYKFVQEYANRFNIKWNNIFIDEASSIYFNPSDPALRFQFLWFITNNWIPMLFKHASISKSSLYHIRDRVDLHSDLEMWLLDNTSQHYDGTLVSSSFLKEYLPFFHENRGQIVLRNSSKLINMINLPSVENQMIYCKPHMTLNSLISYYLTRNVLPTITSNNVMNIFQALDVDFTSVNDYISHHPQKYDLINRKYQESECMICLETCEYPTIVNCCYNIYCGKCLLNNILITHKCPTCREPLLINNISCLRSLRQEITLCKVDVCLDILNNNRSGKFIIYSSFNNIFYQLFEEIDKLGLKAERIDTGLFSLLKIVKNFNKGKTNIIFISNIEMIRGLSLESISHLIFYHDQPVYELKQILIHLGQRIGRQTPLKIIHLNSEIQV